MTSNCILKKVKKKSLYSKIKKITANEIKVPWFTGL